MSEDFINECFKKFMDTIHVGKETALTVESLLSWHFHTMVQYPDKLGQK